MAMGEAQRACYSASELTEALHKLRMIDLARLRRISQYLAHGRQQVGDDALQEAFRRCMSGTRKWPRDLDLVPFLVGVVRSVVEGDTKARRRRRETSLETVGGELSSCDVSAEDQLIRSEDEAAEIARAAETKARVLALFKCVYLIHTSRCSILLRFRLVQG